MPKLQEKPSALKREHPVLKNMKILDFFSILWVIFALLYPDPATLINADSSGSGSETLNSGFPFGEITDHSLPLIKFAMPIYL